MRYKSDEGTWQLDDLPGCSQVCVSHSAFVLPHLQGKGHGTKDHEFRLIQMKELLYDVALATVNLNNKRQVHIMERNGWKLVHTFASSKTQNSVGIYIKDIN